MLEKSKPDFARSYFWRAHECALLHCDPNLLQSISSSYLYYYYYFFLRMPVTYRVSDRHEALSEYPEAVQDYDKSIEIMGPTNPFVPTIMVSRAMVKKKMGDLSQCLAELQQAADMMHISLVRCDNLPSPFLVKDILWQICVWFLLGQAFLTPPLGGTR